jgi:bifunctional DNA-binding transcriptional regulator/antitoxin component of YhaV-PrlF toxin-antitoxin module
MALQKRSVCVNVISNGDPLEIFTDRDELMLKKYSPIATLEKFSKATARSLNDLSGKLAVISKEEGAKMDGSDMNLARLTADILANQFE